MTVRLFQDMNAIESLRSSDFDAISAYGEVVDNSIQAEAKNIKIQFDTEGPNREHRAAHIRAVAFGDDGHGMEKDNLHKCLQIGWSSRYNNRDGIGRFGVGMTLAAIHECTKVEIYSKTLGSTWHYVCLDLKQIADKQDASIAEPSAVAGVPPEYAKLVGTDRGTLVVWSHYDRWSGSEKDLKELLEELDIWLGRTYRYFIWDDNVSIRLNGSEIKAIDPLYARTEKTRFPDDPKAKVYTDIPLEWPRDHGEGNDTILIRMSLLPLEFREKPGQGGRGIAKERFCDRNEGISFLRNRREVFYGEVPFWKAGGTGWTFEEKDRWWGCEVQFPASLDRAFTIKNIKRGANPNPQLRRNIKEKITPTRTSLREEVDQDWAQAKTGDGPSGASSETPAATGHESAQQTANTTPTPRSSLDRNKQKETEADKLLKILGDQYSAERKQALRNLFLSQPFTIVDATWKGADFFETNHLGGTSVLRYNISHDFHQLLGELVDKLEKDPGAASDVAKHLRELIDILLIAYAKAEASFEPDESLPTQDFVDYLRSNWGKFLKSYLDQRRRESVKE